MNVRPGEKPTETRAESSRARYTTQMELHRNRGPLFYPCRNSSDRGVDGIVSDAREEFRA